MLRHSFDQGDAADLIEQAVERVLQAGHRTPDIHEGEGPVVGCKKMGALVRQEIAASRRA